MNLRLLATRAQVRQTKLPIATKKIRAQQFAPNLG
jgi:hypothetical protein